MMNQKPDQKITLSLPHSLYHQLRNEAHRRNLSLPEFIQKKIQLQPGPLNQPTNAATLGELPLKEILARTAPLTMSADERLDFYS